MIKEEVSSEYIASQKGMHGDRAEMPVSRHIVVFGVGEGNIGEAIAETYMAGGADLSIAPPKLDVANYGDVWEWMATLPDDMDTLVLSQGANSMAWFEDQAPGTMADVVAANLTGSMNVAHAFVNMTMMQRHLKHIVFVGSMAYKKVLNASAPYCASKAGLAMLAECLGWELTPKGYRVFCVHPSNVENTPMTRETVKGIAAYRGMSMAEAEEYWGAVNLMPAWLQKEDVADAVVTLTDGADHHGFLSGSQIELKGGQR